jgi:hypothetical protein
VRHHGGVRREVAVEENHGRVHRHAGRHMSSVLLDRPQPRQDLNGRPRAWCGWWMRTQLGGGPELNLARNWAHVGRPSGPMIGAIVVWSHHVGLIVGQAQNGLWVVKSGNDGHAVRERARSVSGAIAFRIL